jgi:putative aldouronate transport system substrate-binding protein
MNRGGTTLANKKAIKKRNLWAAGCSVLLIGSLAAGCTSTKSSTSTTSPSAAASAAPTSAASAAPPKELSLTWMRYEASSQALPADSQAVKEIQKRKNVKLDIQSVPQSNYEDKKKTLIATNTLPDILMVKQDDITNFADSGVFLDLTPYLDKMPNFQKVIQGHPEINKNKLDGKLYGFPLATNWSTQAGQVPMIRTDLLAKLNLKAPTTYDELYEVLKKFKEANPASFPFTSRAANGLTGTQNLINPISFGFGSGYTTFTGAPVYFDTATKAYTFGPASAEFKDAISWLRKLYKDKLLDPDYTTATSQIWQEKLSSGKSFFFQDNNGFGTNFNLALQKTDPNAKFDLLPVMASPKGVKRNSIYQLDHLAESYVVSAKVKDPAAVIQFIDWMYGDEAMKLTNWGIEGVDYTLTNGEYKITDATLAKFKDKPDPFRAMGSAYGLNYLGLSLNADDHPIVPVSPKETITWSDANLKAMADGINFRQVNDPPFTKDEREKLKTLRTQLDAYLTQNLDKFILSEGALNDWDAFVKQANDKGAKDIVAIYNAALARVK